MTPSRVLAFLVCCALVACKEINEPSGDSEETIVEPPAAKVLPDSQNDLNSEPLLPQQAVEGTGVDPVKPKALKSDPYAEIVTIVDVKMRTLQVRIKKLSSSSITFQKLSDHKDYTVSLDLLSEESQVQLKRLAADHAIYLQQQVGQKQPNTVTQPSAAAHFAGMQSGAKKGRNQSAFAAEHYPSLVKQFKERELKAKAFFENRKRAANAVKIGDSNQALHFAPDGSVSFMRDGKKVSTSDSSAWSIYKWTDGNIGKRKSGTRIALDNMAQVGPEELMLWSSDGRFLVNVAVKAKGRYFTFELLHTSNEPKTGGLSSEWLGHRIELNLKTVTQSDGWMLKTFLLNPYAELGNRAPRVDANGIYFSWPYSIWSQTESYPQPQGMVGVYGFASDQEYDSIMTDVWVNEPSLPRPNRANLKAWSHDDVDAWLNWWSELYGKPFVMFSYAPENNYDNLFKIVDVAQQAGVNRVKLHNFDWQGKTIGGVNQELFKNGFKDARRWADYAKDRGVDVHLHGFGQMLRFDDTKYGRNVLDKGLARSALGTIRSVSNGGTVLVIEPDLTVWPGLKLGMLPHYKMPPWGTAKGGLGNAYPPYYESNGSNLKVGKSLYDYTVKLTPKKQWEVKLGRLRAGDKNQKPAVGDLAEFMVMGSGGWMTPDSRKPFLEQLAKEYANAVTQIGGNPHYDGAGWTGDVGSWGMRKFSQMVYENLDRPVDTNKGSAFGIHPFGHMEHQFRRVQKFYKSSPSMLVVTNGDLASYTSGMDDAHYGMNKGAKSKNTTVRGNHKGVSIDSPKKHGKWDELMDLMRLWAEMKPHMSDELRSKVSFYDRRNADNSVNRNSLKDIYIASETDSAWRLTKQRALRRNGIDAPWKPIPERPAAAPRQYMKANGTSIEALQNPYAEQAPVIELHVMADMATGRSENWSLMPQSKNDLQNTKKDQQNFRLTDGTISLTVDNSKSASDYTKYWKNGKTSLVYWTPKSRFREHRINTSSHRGLSITVEGDGSGAVLLFSIGSSFPRSFAVDIDFVGKRTIEIPNGEVVNNRVDWDPFEGQTITSFKFFNVDKFTTYLQKVPAGKKASIKVLDVKALKENHQVGLVDPVLKLNEVEARIRGKIPYDHYLVYSGSDVAKVYDSNWFEVQELSVKCSQPIKVQHGENSFSVSSKESSNTWISSRIKVVDENGAIDIKKP